MKIWNIFDKNKGNSKSTKELFNIEKFSIACVAANNSKFNIQNVSTQIRA